MNDNAPLFAKFGLDPKKKIKLKLVGLNGNAISVMGSVAEAARRQKFPKDFIDAVIEEMMSGEYNHLLATAQKYTEE